MTTLRDLDMIYSGYANPLPEDYIRRTIAVRFSECQCERDAYEWIERNDNPYEREAYATLFLRMLSERNEDMQINTCVRENIEERLSKIIRGARNDQVAEEALAREGLVMGVTGAIDEQWKESVEVRMYDMQQQIDALKEAKGNPVTYMWPYYTAEASEEDKRDFEYQLRHICESKSRGITRDIKTFLENKVKAHKITRPSQLKDEYPIIRRFGYPHAEKTYYNI